MRNLNALSIASFASLTPSRTRHFSSAGHRRPALRTVAAVSLLALSAVAAPHAHAQSLYWDADGATSAATGGTGTWDTTSSLWRLGSATGTLQTYTPNADPSPVSAQFAGTIGTVTIAANTTISANNLTFVTATTGTGYTIASTNSTAILNLSGATTPTITGITGAGFTVIAAKITGTQGFSLTGNFNVFAGDLSGLTGTININGRATLQGYAYGTGIGAFVLSGSQNQTWNVASGQFLTSNNHGNGATIQLGALTGAGTVRSGNDGAGAVPGGDDIFQIGALNTATTFSGSIIDQGTGNITGLTKVGTGTLTLSGTGNSYTGGTLVSAGTLALTGSLTGGVSALATNGTGIATSGTGVVTESGTGIISGNKPFTQGSNGTTTLAGTNTYTGATTINAGVLSILGSTAAGSAVTINGGTLTGTGAVAGAVTIGASGTINPGGIGTVGNLTTGADTFAIGSTLTFDYAGNSVDLLTSTGAVSSLSGVNFFFSGTGGLSNASYNLITASSFANSTLPTSVTGLPSGYQLRFSGNTLQLVQGAAAPEPSAWVTLGLGMVGVGGRMVRAQRRSRRSVCA